MIKHLSSPNVGCETESIDDNFIYCNWLQVAKQNITTDTEFIIRYVHFNNFFLYFYVHFICFQYVCFTPYIKLEDIVYHQNFHAICFLFFIISIALLIIFCITTANTVAPAITKTLVTTYCNQPLPRIRVNFSFSTTRKTTIWDKYISILMPLKNFVTLFSSTPPPLNNCVNQQGTRYQQAHHCISANQVIKDNRTACNTKHNPLVQLCDFLSI